MTSSTFHQHWESLWVSPKSLVWAVSCVSGHILRPTIFRLVIYAIHSLIWWCIHALFFIRICLVTLGETAEHGCYVLVQEWPYKTPVHVGYYEFFLLCWSCRFFLLRILYSWSHSWSVCSKPWLVFYMGSISCALYMTWLRFTHNDDFPEWRFLDLRTCSSLFQWICSNISVSRWNMAPLGHITGTFPITSTIRHNFSYSACNYTRLSSKIFFFWHCTIFSKVMVKKTWLFPYNSTTTPSLFYLKCLSHPLCAGSKQQKYGQLRWETERHTAGQASGWPCWTPCTH